MSLLLFLIGFALGIAAVMFSAVGGLVSLKDRHRVRGWALTLLAAVLAFAGCTWLYQLGEVPS